MALDRAGVRWCLLRGAEGPDVPGGDVDLLVARDDVARFTGAIAPLGFARLPAWGYGSHRFHLGYDAATDRWLKLDVVTELAFGPWFSLPSETAPLCLSRRLRRGSAVVLDDSDAFWCLLLHRLLDKGSVGAAAAALARLARTPGCAESPLAYEIERIAPGSCTPLLLDAARRSAWIELEAVGPALAAAWRRRHRLASLRRRAIGRLARSAGLFLRSRRGMTVALVGPDGAGKSSSAAALARSFPLAVRTVYMSPAMTPRRGPSPRGARLALRIGAQLWRWCRAQALRLRGRLVLFDRYAYDALLPARWPLGPLGRLRRLPGAAADRRARCPRRAAARAHWRARPGGPRGRASRLPAPRARPRPRNRRRRHARARSRSPRRHRGDLGRIPVPLGVQAVLAQSAAAPHSRMSPGASRRCRHSRRSRA